MKIRMMYLGAWAIPGKGFDSWKALPISYDDWLLNFTDHTELQKWVWKNRKIVLGGNSEFTKDQIEVLASNFGESGAFWLNLDEETAMIVEVME